ncbi:MAG: hypothetical protein GX271_11805 [Clostridiales bacterium]|nr:hypothetical protein [Clostridiales bacterium]
MNPYYNQSYTRDQINVILNKINVQLFNVDGEEETVDIYTKFNIIDLSSGTRTVVISFHKPNKPFDYLFR